MEEDWSLLTNLFKSLFEDLDGPAVLWWSWRPALSFYSFYLHKTHTKKREEIIVALGTTIALTRYIITYQKGCCENVSLQKGFSLEMQRIRLLKSQFT